MVYSDMLYCGMVNEDSREIHAQMNSLCSTSRESLDGIETVIWRPWIYEHIYIEPMATAVSS